jgi:hypothetical protein
MGTGDGFEFGVEGVPDGVGPEQAAEEYARQDGEDALAVMVAPSLSDSDHDAAALDRSDQLGAISQVRLTLGVR